MRLLAIAAHLAVIGLAGVLLLGAAMPAAHSSQAPAPAPSSRRSATGVACCRAALSDPICRVGCSGLVPKRIRWDHPDLKTVARPYPEGVVIVEAGIDQKGQVVSACMLRGVRNDFDEAAQIAVLKWKFDPLVLQGQPVSVFLTVTVCTPDRQCEQ